MKLNKQIMKSRNRGLFNSLLEEIESYDFKMEVKYFNCIGFVAYIKNKEWKEVYLK